MTDQIIGTPQANNPFDDTETDSKGNAHIIHIRIQQRNGRKTLTTVAGLPKDLDKRRVLKAFKREFACNGNLVSDEATGDEIIQLQGDQRAKVSDLLVAEGVCKREAIKIHGF